MDDFGSGYSSLNLLQDTHFDLIKLDMRFMRNFGEKNELIVGAMLSMANLMGVKTLAEGVESEEQLNFLRKAGCQRIQGYYYGRPRPLDEILAHLETIPPEKIEDMDYYEKISQFNLSDPFSYSKDSLVSGMLSAVPCCISEWHEETEELLMLRSNESFEKVLEVYDPDNYDFDQVGKNEHYLFHPRAETIDHIRETIKDHQWQGVCLPFRDKQLTIYIHDIAKNNEGHHALVIVTIITDK